MSNKHPITPPPELVQRWIDEENGLTNIATQAAQWGSDQELEACAEWVGSMFHGHKTWTDELRSDRRPKEPTLKEQALEALTESALDTQGNSLYRIIHKALEQLPND